MVKPALGKGLSALINPRVASPTPRTEDGELLFEARFPGARTEAIDERCPERITPRSAAFQLAARTLTGENFRQYFEDYDVAHSLADSEAVPG